MILLYCEDIDRRTRIHNYFRDLSILVDAAPLGEYSARSFAPEVEALLIVGPAPHGLIAHVNMDLPLISVGQYQLGDSFHFRDESSEQLIELLRSYSGGEFAFAYNDVLFGCCGSVRFLGYPLSLTPTERAILYYLVKNCDRVVSFAEMNEICIGDAHRKPASLIKHISDINQKARAIGGRNMIYSPLSGYYKIKKYI